MQRAPTPRTTAGATSALHAIALRVGRASQVIRARIARMGVPALELRSGVASDCSTGGTCTGEGHAEYCRCDCGGVPPPSERDDMPLCRGGVRATGGRELEVSPPSGMAYQSNTGARVCLVVVTP